MNVISKIFKIIAIICASFCVAFYGFYLVDAIIANFTNTSEWNFAPLFIIICAPLFVISLLDLLITAFSTGKGMIASYILVFLKLNFLFLNGGVKIGTVTECLMLFALLFPSVFNAIRFTIRLIKKHKEKLIKGGNDADYE